MRYFSALILVCLGFCLHAQDVLINDNVAVNTLVKNWTNNNRINPGVSGWRVQIMSTTDRQAAEDMRNTFRQAHPDIPAEWIHEKPYYKVRAGAFRSKQEALSFINDLDDIASAYPVIDKSIHPRLFVE